MNRWLLSIAIAQNQQYDPWVEKIVKSFVPSLQGAFDRIVQ